MPESTRGRFWITTDPARFDLDAIHAYLTRSFWASGIPKDVVAKSLRDSLSFALFDGARQIGFARMVTDCATFAYLCDVYVLEEYRGQGLGKWLMEEVMAHTDLQGLRRILLVTRDAHGLYDRHGFTPLLNPERHMELFRPGIYRQGAPEAAAQAWQLVSDSGREAVRWEVRERQETRRGPALRCDVSLTGRYFGDGLADEPPGSRSPDYLVVFRNLMVGLAELARLQAHLDAWLGLSAGEQARHALAFECTVGELFDQSLVLALGRRDDTLSGGRPAATLRYRAGRVEGEMSFVTSASGLRPFAKGIAACL